MNNRFADNERAVVLVLPDDQLDKILIGNVDDNDQQWNRSTFWKLSGLQKVSTREDVASLEEETTTDFSTEKIEICAVHFCDNLKTSPAMTTTEETTMETTEVTTESIIQEQTKITRMEKGKMKPAILPVTEHVAKMKSNEQSLSTMDSLKLPTEIPCLCEILDFVDSPFDNIIKQMVNNNKR
ncbi:hypothetical protein ACOME3_004688 [Neoechinorhynchus agilis]